MGAEGAHPCVPWHDWAVGGTEGGPGQGWDRDRLTPPLTCPRYHLAVTRRHENEPSSSSIYTQNDPWDPPVTFESFIHDNETIEDQVTPGDTGHMGVGAAVGPGGLPSPGGHISGVCPSSTGFPISHRCPQLPRGAPWCHRHPGVSRQDLVAWVTVGFLHVPHAEDIPNTATPGNAVGFFLRPFNFFSEDPSVASRAPVIVRPLDPPACSRLEIRRWTPASPGPCVHPEPFSYNGTYRQV